MTSYDKLPSLSDIAAEMEKQQASEPAISKVRLSNADLDAILQGAPPPVAPAANIPPWEENIATRALEDDPAQSSNRRFDPPDSVTEADLQSYVEAAALRYSFRLDRLTPASGAAAPPPYARLTPRERDAVFAYLTSRCDIVTDVHGNIEWMLRDDERRQALERLLSSGNVTQAIEAAQPDATQAGPAPIERLLWNTLQGWSTRQGELLNLEGQSVSDLLLTQRVVDWLPQPPSGTELPSRAAIEARLARETLLQPFRHLTGEWRDGQFVSTFTGRTQELERLYDYLGVLPPRSLLNALGRTVGALTDSAWSLVNRVEGHRPLLIHGPGGVGKSALLAKFLLDHLTLAQPRDQFPFAYLDLDLAALNVLEPVTLLAEAARQLAEEAPASRGPWTEERSAWLQAIARSPQASLDPEQRAKIVQRFGQLVRESWAEHFKAAKRPLPFLLVVDTFEELQYKSRDAVRGLFRFLNELRRHLPELHVVLMGRAPLRDVSHEYAALESVAIEGDAFDSGLGTDFNVIEVPLADLPRKEALEYLARYGVNVPELAEDLVTVVGGSPLVLRLIVRVLQQDDVDLVSLRKEMEWQPGLSDRLRGRKVPPKALLQGVLFKRILGHIHDKEVGQLAHPGLVLRRITPDLIQDVLAGPCGLAPLTEAQANSLFARLAAEVALVGTERSPEGESELRHRPELRQVMLRLMEADTKKKDQIRQVHENAVRYYDREGANTRARIEALYHRLMLGETPRPEAFADDVPTDVALESGYASPPDPDADSRPLWWALAPVTEEVPIASACYLDARLTQELVPDASYQNADWRDWALRSLGLAARRAQDPGLLRSALTSLRRDRDRGPRTPEDLALASPLPLIEITLTERLGNLAAAAKQVNQALAARKNAPEIPPRRLAEYNLLGARVAAKQGNDKSCVQHLAEAARLVADAQAPNGTAWPRVHRTDRQLLRIAAECLPLISTGEVFQILVDSLLRVAERTDGLAQHPVLARYAVGSAVTVTTLELQEQPAHRLLLDKASLTPLLAALLDRTPPASLTRAVRVLADWLRESTEGESPTQVFVDIVPEGADTRNIRLVRSGWQRRLEGTPGAEVGEWLSQLFQSASISDEHLIAFFQALDPQPDKPGAPGDDLFEEARRAGDLLPGEGPPAPPADPPRRKK